MGDHQSPRDERMGLSEVILRRITRLKSDSIALAAKRAAVARYFGS
jgi:hypothetical protein